VEKRAGAAPGPAAPASDTVADAPRPDSADFPGLPGRWRRLPWTWIVLAVLVLGGLAIGVLAR
jgi:hypothetical protein